MTLDRIKEGREVDGGSREDASAERLVSLVQGRLFLGDAVAEVVEFDGEL